MLAVLLLATTLAALDEAHPPKTGTVTATLLNVRIRPGTQGAVVAQLRRGDTVAILGQQQDWCQIPLPAAAAVWVAASFLADGRTTAEVHLRSGPGILHGEYGMLPSGTAVALLDDTREGWRRIVPPAGLTAWISASHVSVPPDETAVPATPTEDSPAPSPFPGEAAVAPAVPVPAAVDPAPPKQGDDTLAAHLPVLGTSAEDVSVDGFIVPLAADSVFVTHAICTQVNGEYFPLCYVHAERQNLKLWEGQRVRVSGSQQWVLGWQRPVVHVRKITPIR
jgi:uncharacterized protein YraI